MDTLINNKYHVSTLANIDAYTHCFVCNMCNLIS
jgi:hypothetical protein